MTEVPAGEGRTAAGAAVAVAVAVLAGWLALVGAWLALLALDEGLSRVVWAVLGALLFWHLRPRPARVRRAAVVVGDEEAPGLHALAETVAEAVGCHPPRRVLLETTYPVAAVPVGYAGRSDLVVGLPQWTVLRPRERLAAVAMVLAEVESQRAAGTLVRLANDLLVSARELLEPPGAARGDEVAAGYSVSNPIAVGTFEVNRVGRSAATNVGAAGMTALAAPLRWVQRGLLRLWRPRLVATVHDADARAAGVAGRDAVVGVLLTTAGTPLGLTAAASAARYGRDPFEALAEAERPDPAQARRLLAAGAGGAASPGAGAAGRVEALERGAPFAASVVDPGLATRADADVLRLRSRLADQLVDELRMGLG